MGQHKILMVSREGEYDTFTAKEAKRKRRDRWIIVDPGMTDTAKMGSGRPKRMRHKHKRRRPYKKQY